jgi:hydrogenase maturation protease
MKRFAAKSGVSSPLPRILILGYGNPGRQDDGLGPAFVNKVNSLNLPHVSVDADYQLNIEDGATIADYDIVVFVDAAKDIAEPYTMSPLAASDKITFTSHTVSPDSILAICEDHFGARPEAYVMAIRGYEYEFQEGLTPRAEENMNAAMTYLKSRIQQWKEQVMDTARTLKKTVLTIDDDPDIRAALAASGEDGIKTTERINPDAVIVDLMMEAVDSGSTVVKKLKEQGFMGPIYMLSSAGDTVRFNIDSDELGLAGIFQKPVDPREIVNTIKVKLGM